MKYRIIVCRGPECGDRRNSAVLHPAFAAAIRARGLEGQAELAWHSCFGRCRQGPNVLVRLVNPNEKFLFAMAPLVGAGKNAALYNGVRVEDCPRIVDEHVANGRIVRELVKRPDAEGTEPGIIPPKVGDK